MPNKKKLQELKDELTGREGRKYLEGFSLSDEVQKQQNELYARIGEHIFHKLKAYNTDNIAKAHKEALSKIEESRESFEKQHDGISKLLTELSSNLESGDVELHERLDAFQEEFDSRSGEFTQFLEDLDTKHSGYDISHTKTAENIEYLTKVLGDMPEKFENIKKSYKEHDKNLKLLQEGHGIHLKKFDGVDKHFLELEKDLKKYASNIYEYGSSLSVLVGGTLVGMGNQNNFAAGSNLTLSSSTTGTLITVTISANSGGFTRLTATGTVNDSNTAFTFIQKPSFIVSDGVWIEPLDANGNVNWSWNAGTLTATLTIPQNSAIWGIA